MAGAGRGIGRAGRGGGGVKMDTLWTESSVCAAREQVTSYADWESDGREADGKLVRLGEGASVALQKVFLQKLRHSPFQQHVGNLLETPPSGAI
eukprot:jgi/Botrbrau1/10923/Bobra.0025s0096.1